MKALWFAAAWLLIPLLGAAQEVPTTEVPADVAEQRAATPDRDTSASSDEVNVADADAEAKVEAETETTDAPTTADVTRPAFVLTVSATDEIKTLLERHLEIQRYRALTDLSDDELDRLLDMARLDTQKLLATLGYFSPVIEITRDKADPTPGRAVHISVVAGEPVQVSQVQLRFNGPIATDPRAAAQRALIEDTWLLPAGNRMTQSAWSAAKQQALRQLTSQRYPTGTLVDTLADVDPATLTARLTVTLDSGPAYQLGPLVTTGLQRYDADLVRRLARLTEGDDYDLTELVAAQQRLATSGYFNSAFMRVDTTTDPQAAQVQVTVREARLQKVTLGVGASTDSGARLSVEHHHNLMPVLGWQALSKIAVDRETQSVGVELTAPPDDRGWRWNTSALFQNEPSGSFDIGSRRLQFGSTRLSERIDRSYYLQYDRADTATSDATAAQVAESVSVNYAFTLREFDALPFPSSGWAVGVELGGGTTLGSDRAPFSRVLTRWQAFWPMGTHSADAAPDRRAGRLALRAQVGAVVVRDGVNLPATQLFLAGGANSVRGYRLRSIGVELADGEITAGRYLATGSVEWQRPITNNGRLTDWEGVVFVDAGSVANQAADLNTQVGLGAGVRWKTPVGPLQIDLAYGVEVKKLRLHLNVGFVF